MGGAGGAGWGSMLWAGWVGWEGLHRTGGGGGEEDRGQKVAGLPVTAALWPSALDSALTPLQPIQRTRLISIPRTHKELISRLFTVK